MKITKKSYAQQNAFYDARTANNGGGYDQPLIVVEFDDGAVFEIADTSCGDFGSRIDVVATIGDEKFYSSYGTMENRCDTDFSDEELPYLDLIAEEVGYHIPYYDSLPSETIVEISELNCCLNDEEKICDAVVEFLTDNFGFCIRGCEISLEDEGLAKVSNIEWDTDE